MTASEADAEGMLCHKGVLPMTGISILSFTYLVFLVISCLVRYLCPGRFRTAALLVCCLVFYCTWNPVCLIFLLVTIVTTFMTGRYVGKRREQENGQKNIRKTVVFALCVILNLGILIYCKYWGMLFPGIFEQRLLPVGISFYTLQALGYVADCRRKGNADESFAEYALFVSFFPGILSGPIERKEGLLAQIRELPGRKISVGHDREEGAIYENLRSGVMIMLWGYFLKLVLADRIAVVVNTVYGNLSAWKGTMVVLAVFLYSLQIYCDFAGYSAIAIGSARVLGFHVMQNFRAPYLETSVAGFWRRWHISLSSWFRDYLYIPLGGNRKGILRRYFNFMIVFAVSGLWHGADVTFLIWGLLHGMYQVVGHATRPLRSRICSALEIDTRSFSHRLLQAGITYVLVSLAWVFFRADSLSAALDIFRAMRGFSIWQLGDGSLLKLGLDTANWILLAAGILILTAKDSLLRAGFSLRRMICRQGLWFRYLLIIGAVLLILVCGIWGPDYDAATFIYSQF